MLKFNKKKKKNPINLFLHSFSANSFIFDRLKFEVKFESRICGGERRYSRKREPSVDRRSGSHMSLA